MAGYRRRLMIDHTRVMNVDQKDFPVLVSLTDARLKSASHGGRVTSDRGEDIFFVLPDGKTRLTHEVVAYAPETGVLKAWVRVPDLSSSQDTEFFMYYGNPAAGGTREKVWDAHVRLVQHLRDARDPVTVPHSDALNIRDEITVEAWVRGDAYQPEAMQALVSRWESLTSFNTFNAFDAGNTDGLDTSGFYGAAFDGRYFYAAPDFDPHADKMHGRILRYDTAGKNASFCLKYGDFGHNGGLCAAAPGPSFHVNTVKGTVVGIAAPRPLLPGWHHLTGVYNGRTIKLFVDGALVGERSGAGAIQTNAVDIAIGRMTGGAARFRGVIDEVRISDIARGDDWIKTAYQNLANPSRFVRAGEEEQVT